MKKYLLLLCLGFAMVACGDKNDDPKPEPGPYQGRTVLAYLISNNKEVGAADLDSYLKSNILMMYQGLSSMTDRHSLLVYYRPKSKDSYFTSPTILKYETDGSGRVNGKSALVGNQLTVANVLEEGIVVRQYDESQIATDPLEMSVILKDMVNAVPSDSYGLVFGSHGTGWLPGNKTRSFGDDDAYSINIPELAEALSQSSQSKFDFILFDACLMGSIEVLYELRNVTQYCIVSPQEIPTLGLPYTSVLPLLYSANIVNSAREICDQYIMNNEEERLWGTITFADCTSMDAFAEILKEELLLHKEQLRDFDEQLQQYGINSFKYMSCDLLQFIEVLNGGSVPASFKEAFDDVVLYTNCIENDYYRPITREHYSGIGLYIPSMGQKVNWNNYFKTLDWYSATGWNQID